MNLFLGINMGYYSIIYLFYQVLSLKNLSSIINYINI